MYGLKREDSIILRIDRDLTTIGRHTSNNVVINALPVSRHHSCIVRIDGRYFIKDQNTVNGTFIKKHRLLPDRETLLKVGDSIGIGAKAGENSRCTFEVVLIQFESSNEIAPSHEEVDSSTDGDQAQLGNPPREEPAVGTRKNSASNVSISETSTLPHTVSDVREKEGQNSSEDTSHISSSKLASTPKDAILETKVEPKNRPTAAVVPMTEPSPTVITTAVYEPPSLEGEVGTTQYISDDVEIMKAEPGSRTKNHRRKRVMVIDLCDDDDDGIGREDDVLVIEERDAASAVEEIDEKPLFKSGVQYSFLDEITLLDSDDEDFPCSQFDATNVDDFPDLTNSLQSIFTEEDDLDSPECPKSLHCLEESWFESSKRNLLIDLPMTQPQKPKDGKKDSSSFVSEKSKELHVTKHRSLKRPFSKNDTDTDTDSLPEPQKRKHLFGSASKPSTSHEEKSVSQGTIHDLVPRNLLPLVLISPLKLEDQEALLKSEDQKALLKSERKKESSETPEDDVFRSKKKRKKDKHRPKTQSNGSRQNATFKKSEIKDYRKVRLQKLTPKEDKKPETAPKPESANRAVVVKITKENRADKMYKSNDEKNTPMYMELEVAPGCEERRKEMHGFDESFYDDALDLCSQVPAESTQSTAKEDAQVSQKEIQQANATKVECKRIAHVIKKMKSSSERTSLASNLPAKEKDEHSTSKVGFEKNEGRRASVSCEAVQTSTVLQRQKNEASVICEAVQTSVVPQRQKNEASVICETAQSSTVLLQRKQNQASVSCEAVQTSVVPQRQKNEASVNRETAQTSSVLQRNKNHNARVEKSLPPKLGFYIDTLEKRTEKRVHFNTEKFNCQWLEIDPEERCNVTHTSSYKVKASLMKEKQFELESAIACACKWRVDWLKEQQVPSKIYSKTIMNCELPFLKLLEYKENLKEVMFFHLWSAVSVSHNRPNLDYLPNTQCLIEGKRGIYSLWIESIDTSWTSPHLRTITAFREVDETAMSDELTSGLMVVLNLRVKETANVSHFSRANIFAYITSAHQILNIGGVMRQRVIFKIFQGNFEIKMGEMKVKVLTYTRLLLRRFEAFAMLDKSPLISLLICQQIESLVPPIVQERKNFVDVFLDFSQKWAIVRCMSSIASPEPCVNLVDGSPGTGKTQVIVSLMREMFSTEKGDQFPEKPKVLIITKNDNLGDDLVQRLEKGSVLVPMNVLRYGRSKLMNHKIKYCCIEDRIRRLIEEDADNTLVDLEEETRSVLAKKNSFELILQSKSLTEEKKTSAQLRLTALQNEYADLLASKPSKTKDQLLRRAAKNKAFEDADVVVTSINECWTSSSRFDDDFAVSDQNIDDVSKFTVCIFDDANYMDEVQMLIPILLLVPKLILVGDSRNEFHFKKGEQSPFCRLVRDFKNRNSAAISCLTSQHRIPPAICKWLDNSYGLSCQPKQAKPSRLASFLVVHLQIENPSDVDYGTKLRKQANFCYQLALKTKEIEKDTPIAIIVASQEEKKILLDIIPFSVMERTTMYLCTWDDILGRDYDVVIACLPMKRRSIDSWLYIASSRARHHLFMCGYFEEDGESVRWSKAELELMRKSMKWNVDDDFPSDHLRSRPNTG